MKSAAFMVLGVGLAFIGFATAAHPEPPNLQTPAPVIFLADNLDEQDALGYCIDTIGRGLSDRLHVHSCKPRGGDVQYRFDPVSGHIASPTFDNKCAALLGAPAPGMKLALLDCEDVAGQAFEYDEGRLELHPAGRADLCLATGPDSYPAGRFMKRDLLLSLCAETAKNLRQWVVKDAD